MKTTTILLAAALLLGAAPAFAGIDLVTLPERSSVQLTIYNSADLTLVREVRNLTLKKGINKLSFGWANTLIDPTSLDLRAVKNPAAVQLLDIAYPPRVNTEGVWTVQSDIEGEVPVEITFFTSGITWRAFYMATLAGDEKTMQLQGYVRVANGSGEDYENAQTRLVVGKMHLLDQIADLARRSAPYGTPMSELSGGGGGGGGGAGFRKKADLAQKARGELVLWDGELGKAKEIVKEGLSEYFLYTIEGTETIPNTWSKRLPSFDAADVPVENLYKYDEARYGNQVIRFLFFANDEKHKLGQTPLPDGLVKVYRTTDAAAHLSYEGADNTKYIPVDQKAELNLGPARKVMVEPKMMKTAQAHFSFDRDGNINGWEEVEDWRVEVKNSRDLPVRVELKRHLKHPYWDLKPAGESGQFEKEDATTVKFNLDLKPGEKRIFTYQVRYLEGERRQPN